MIHKLDENGFAVLTVFLIGTFTMALVSMVYMLLNLSTHMSGQDKKYLTELEVAKGASEYIMASLRNDSLQCGTGAGTDCTAGDPILFDGSICTPLGKTGCSGLSATYLSEITHDPGGSLPEVTLVAVQVNSTSANTSEQALIQFVYKIY
jgi:hypothetical protein